MTIFYEKFMEQRFQKLNNSEHPGMEDSLLFPIEHYRAAPLPRERVSDFRSEFGVNSPHALLPAMPVTPVISQPQLMPSTSR